MKYNPISRRLFLQGLGKSTLIIPLLPSLLPKEARAQAVTIAPRYYSLFMPYGPVQDNFHPNSTGMIKTQIFPASTRLPAYEIASKNLTASTNGLSFLFDNKYNNFVSKMLFLKGLDTRDGGHHYAAGPLGNMWGVRPTEYPEYRNMPTIDHIMAYAPNFYPNNGAGNIRQLVLGLNFDMNYGEGFAYGFTNALNRSGPVIHLDNIYQHNPLTLFNYVFGSYQAPAPTSTTPMVDSVLASFRKVRDGRMISSEDKVALQNHVDLLAQLEAKLSAGNQTLSCTIPAAPRSIQGRQPYLGPSDAKAQTSLINDVIFAAFRCQITRVANFNLHYLQYNNLHIHEGDPGFDNLKNSQKVITDNAILDIVTKLDSFTEANGKTVLDNSLVHYHAASGPYSHSQYSHPSLIFGTANGKIKSGQFIDYRMQDATANKSLGSNSTGLLQNQLLVTIMQAMGLTPQHYNMASLGLLRSNYSPTTSTYGEFVPRNGSDNDSFRYVDPEKIAGQKLPLL